ncbi:hypothetical protein IIA16_01375, partial [bacterium]|nr:hypothetical protein [bacterium]
MAFLGEDSDPDAVAEQAWRRARGVHIVLIYSAAAFAATGWYMAGSASVTIEVNRSLGSLNLALLLVAAVELTMGHLGMPLLRRLNWSRARLLGRSAVEVEGGVRLIQRAAFEVVAIFGAILALLNKEMLWAIGGGAIALLSLVSALPNLERYREITGADIEGVLNGIQSARFVGFRALKINTVVLRGVNDDEVIDLAVWALSRGLEIRFLEAMPIGPAADFNRRAFVSGAEIEATLATRFRLKPLPRNPGETARRFRATCRSADGVI